MHYVSPYHPQSNGACERLNGTLINMLASYTNNDNQNRWMRFITMVVFAYNTSTHSTTGFTPFFLVHGREASIGSDAALSVNTCTDVRSLPEYVREMQYDLAFAHQHIADRVKQNAEDREKLNNELKTLAEFQPGDIVYVYAPPKSGDGNSRKLMSPYHGPYTVIRATSRVTYSLRNNHTNKKIVAHITLMKKSLTRPDHLLQPQISIPAVAAAPLAAQAAASDPENSVIADPAPQAVSRNTRKQRAALESNSVHKMLLLSQVYGRVSMMKRPVLVSLLRICRPLPMMTMRMMSMMRMKMIPLLLMMNSRKVKSHLRLSKHWPLGGKAYWKP